jgi:hypothetical protein
MGHSLKKIEAVDEIFRLAKMVRNPEQVGFIVDIPPKQMTRYAMAKDGTIVFKKYYFEPISKR